MPSSPETNVVLIILLVLASIGFAGFQASRGRKGAGASEYFLASRSIGPLALAASLSVTTVWGLWSLYAGMPVGPGLAGWAIPGGVVVAGLVLLGLVFAPLYRASSAVTLPAFLGERYGRGVAVAVAGVSIGVTLLVRIPFTILVGAHLLNVLLGWELMSSALLMIVFPGLIVIAGGYRAVIAAHGVGGIAAAAGILFLAFGGFFPAEAVLHRVMPGEGSPTFLAGGMAVVGFWFTCGDQHIVQRAIAARSCSAMRWGALLAALLVVLGIAGIGAGFDVVPSGGAALGGGSVAAGIVGAAIVAFVMSSLAGLFLNAATVFAMDLFRAGRKRGDEAALVLVGRLASTVIVILAISAASSIALRGEASMQGMGRVLSIAMPPVVAILLLGLAWGRMHGRGAFWALLAGWAAGIVCAGLSGDGVGALLQDVVMAFVVSGVVCVGVSLATVPHGVSVQVAGPVPDDGLEVRRP